MRGIRVGVICKRPSIIRGLAGGDLQIVPTYCADHQI
jgi:hypothetical protein